MITLGINYINPICVDMTAANLEKNQPLIFENNLFNYVPFFVSGCYPPYVNI